VKSRTADGRISPHLAATVAAIFMFGALISAIGVFAAKPVSPTFLDYAQCANGAPGSTALDCPDGWINGILQASNSHYTEDQVTPQRAAVSVPTGASLTGHTLTFTYQARKGSAQTHAYDSLATWNYTQTEADRCQDLAEIDCPGGAISTWGIPDDPQVLAPVGAGKSGVTTNHMIPAGVGRQFQMFGGTITGATTPIHDCVAAGKCNDPSVDDYATITVTYQVAAVPAKVQLLFGGHLAVGSSGGSRTWGLGFGASNISGGPYHIKWTASDGASIGNRDNQIMGSAIIFVDTTLTTQVKKADGTDIPNDGHVTVPVTVYDTATLADAFTDAGGTVTYYYGTAADCSSGTSLGSKPVSSGIVPNSDSVTLNAAGTYEFWAVYSGDQQNNGSSSNCGDETVIVDKASPSFTTSALPTGNIVVGTATDISDTATMSGGYLPSGNVSFQLYLENTCTTAVAGVGGTVALSSGSATYSTNWTPTSPGDYFWKVQYLGDDNNNATTAICNGPTDEQLDVIKASPSFTTQATPTADIVVGTPTTVGDTATFTGGFNITGTVLFTLWTNSDCTGAAGVSGSAEVSGGVATFTTAPNAWTPTALGTYYFSVEYLGDANNEATGVICDGPTDERLNVVKASPDGSTSPTAQIQDTFTISGGYFPTGTVNFYLFTTSDCSGTAIDSDLNNLLSGGSATSDWFSVSAGTYYWQTVYSGDDFNNGKTLCGEQTDVGLSTVSVSQ
jgi:hypothetical protein